MGLKPFRVTKKKNVRSFDPETGVFELIDDKIVGLAVAEHIIPFSRVVKKPDPTTGLEIDTMETGFSEMLSVLWNHVRHPAIRHEALAELVWLEIEKDEDTRIGEEPYTSLEHIIELAEEGDGEAAKFVEAIKAFSDSRLAEEDEEESKDEDEEADDEEDVEEDDDAPEITM